MPQFQMFDLDGPPEALICPVFVCRQCRKPAHDLSRPNSRSGGTPRSHIVWFVHVPLDGTPRRPDLGPYVVHQGQCDRLLTAAIEAEHPGRVCLWRPLAEAAAQLAYNTIHPLDEPDPPDASPALPQKRRTKLPFRTVWDRDNWKCRRCGSHQDLTVDHIIPLVRGGTDDLENLQTLCRSCNSSKGASLTTVGDGAGSAR